MMTTITTGIMTFSKIYDPSYYSGVWFYNLTFDVEVDVEICEEYEETPSVKRIDKPKGKSNWKNGTETRIIELLQVNRAFIITGHLDDPTICHSWDVTTLNGGINASIGTIDLIDGSTFPATNGLILIDNEFIFYKTRTSNQLTDCQRGFGDTVAASHSNAVAVGNRTDGAVHKRAMLDFMKKHGGTVTMQWRNQSISVFIKKWLIKDTKKEHDGGSAEPTRYNIVLNAFEATLQ